MKPKIDLLCSRQIKVMAFAMLWDLLLPSVMEPFHCQDSNKCLVHMIALDASYKHHVLEIESDKGITEDLINRHFSRVLVEYDCIACTCANSPDRTILNF